MDPGSETRIVFNRNNLKRRRKKFRPYPLYLAWFVMKFQTRILTVLIMLIDDGYKRGSARDIFKYKNHVKSEGFRRNDFEETSGPCLLSIPFENR